MNRWVWLSICALLGVVTLLCGLLVPAHLRAVDVSVLRTAGEGDPALIERGLTLVDEQQLGAAELLLQAARELNLSGTEALAMAVTNLAGQDAELRVWGAPFPEGFSSLSSTQRFGPVLEDAGAGAEPLTDLMIRRENRERVLDVLRMSALPDVQDLMRCRALTNTVIFSPSDSASGQVFDAAIAVGGLLLREHRLTSRLSDAIFKAGLRARNHNDSEAFERILLDLMSLGQRMNWGQLTTFVVQIEDPKTLRVLSDHLRNAGEDLPVLASALEVSGNPSAVGEYLTELNEKAFGDLRTSLQWGAGGMRVLLESHKPLSHGSFQRYLPTLAALDSWNHFASKVYLHLPHVALAAKWMLYFLSGFFIAAAMHFARRPVTALERPLQVRGFHLARESLFALGYLLIVLVLSEPFLSQGAPKAERQFQLRLPTVGGVIHAGTQVIDRSFMNHANLLTLLVFFVMQGLIYTACIVKLAEIGRQKVPARMKLKLLENEEHLFDAGLYLGFVGTIVSLMLVSLGITHFSLMAAYSSTSFGIVFVSFFKIVHLRPARRKLLLQAESALPKPVRAAVTPALAVRP